MELWRECEVSEISVSELDHTEQEYKNVRIGASHKLTQLSWRKSVTCAHHRAVCDCSGHLYLHVYPIYTLPRILTA